MDVSLPIRSVIPSLDGPVINVLAATDAPLSLTELHRRAQSGSLSGVRRVLLRLQRAGLVHVVPGGYVLNRAHIAAPALDLLAQLYGELTRRIREVLSEWDGSVLVAGLYGSAARRDGDERSDIDVLVVSDSPGLDDLADDLADRIRLWTGNRAQVTSKTTADLARMRRANEPIVQSWERELVTLVGDRRHLRTVA